MIDDITVYFNFTISQPEFLLNMTFYSFLVVIKLFMAKAIIILPPPPQIRLRRLGPARLQIDSSSEVLASINGLVSKFLFNSQNLV